MDHVIEGMKPHFEVLLDWFIEEHRKGNYKKLLDNPYYDEIKALIDSMNILRKYLGWNPVRLKDEVNFYL